MATVHNPPRANIRIEIKNDFTEDMEVTEESNTLSEGEVEDDETEETSEDPKHSATKNKIFFHSHTETSRKDNSWANNEGGFTTGVNIFGKDAQEKLQTRAQRFGLNPEECKGMTDQQLQELHDSLGITEEDEIQTRFETIHMYGTKEMSTQDVFGYFGKYGPSSIEWINDECCNVVWLDKISAARAFHGLSSRIAGMPIKGPCNPFKEEETAKAEAKETGRSILLVNQTREVELYDENADTGMKEESSQEKGTVHASDIPIPIPPGYWRLGVPHPKAEYVLFRFAKRTDKKPLRAEKFSEYYKKYGNPNYGGMKGLISESKKRRMKGYGTGSSEKKEQLVEIVKGNPWGKLAKNWNNDIEEYTQQQTDVPYASKPSKSILQRLGNTNKRSHEDIENGANTEGDKKSKIPRMRMYADEEEVKIEKAKQLKKIRELEEIEELLLKNTTRPQVMDLRDRLGKQKMMPRQTAGTVVAERLTNSLVSNISNFKLRSDNVESISLKQRLQRIPSTLVDDINLQQKSKVTVIVKKPKEPNMASTIWSRLDKDKRIPQKEEDEESASVHSSDSESSEKCSDSEKLQKSKFQKTERPGFSNLKSRLGLNTEHKSPLRIEINNDHYKKS